MPKPKRILIVDDDTEDQLLFCEAVKQIKGDYECTMAYDGQEALIKAIIPPPYDIIFLDLNMPVMDGYECLKRLKQNPQLEGIPVVVLSTSDHVYDTERCRALGVTAYMTKPDSFSKLVTALAAILAPYK